MGRKGKMYHHVEEDLLQSIISLFVLLFYLFPNVPFIPSSLLPQNEEVLPDPLRKVQDQVEQLVILKFITK